jgi:site-specific recombinase XerD
MDRTCINTHILPLLGTKLITGLGRADIERLQADSIAGKTAKKRNGRGGHTTGGQGAAFRTVTMLHSIFEHGIRTGIVEANPVKGIRKAAPQPRDRSLSEKEIIHLGKTITLSETERESPTGLAGLLGHASRSVTQRYIHLDEALVVAADRISERMANLLETGRREARNHKSNSKNPKRVRNVCSQVI